VVTTTHVHRQLHGQVRGHVALAPAAQRAADPDLRGLVEDEMTEQTACADDTVADEERRRAQRRRRPAAGGRRARPRGPMRLRGATGTVAGGEGGSVWLAATT